MKKNLAQYLIVIGITSLMPLLSFAGMEDNCPEAKEVYVSGGKTLHFYTYNRDQIVFSFDEANEGTLSEPSQSYSNFEYQNYRYDRNTQKLKCTYTADYESPWGDQKYSVTRTFTSQSIIPPE